MTSFIINYYYCLRGVCFSSYNTIQGHRDELVVEMLILTK